VPCPDQPFAQEAGIRAPFEADGDPYRLLDELMAVIEALCPVWPPRAPSPSDGARMLI